MIQPNQPGGSKYVVRGGSKIVVIDLPKSITWKRVSKELTKLLLTLRCFSSLNPGF